MFKYDIGRKYNHKTISGIAISFAILSCDYKIAYENQ